jgi:transposase-like protein
MKRSAFQLVFSIYARVLTCLMGATEADVLSFTAFRCAHRPTLPSTNPIERLNKEVKRRADNVGAILLEQNDDWQLQHRYMSLETMASLVDVAAPPPEIAA